MNIDNFYEFSNRLILEAGSGETHIIIENLYPKINDVLKTPVGNKKFKHIVGSYMDKHSEVLHKCGPTKLIPFGDKDKAEFLALFNLEKSYLDELINKVLKNVSSGTDFKLLKNNYIFWVFYCCIRFFYLKKDNKGLNTALAIYALSVYPSIHHKYFPYDANEGVMQYTIDHLTEKFLIKQTGNLFGALFLSINHSYEFLKNNMNDGSDKEIIRFIQRIHNDQNSLIKNIAVKYMVNHSKGLRVKLTKGSNSDEIAFDDEADNNTTIVEVVSTNVVNQILTNGLDLRRVTQCKDLANIGLSDCRYYLTKIVSSKYSEEISKFIHAILFLFLYDEGKKKEEINSSYFLVWSSELFRKTNSNNVNIKCIKDTLDKWGEESGVHSKFKREASRVNYKKAIFWYFILSIQYYNK